jgi:ABC-type Zn uptake system ZnuABC Zn-binding protein ZnuA
MSGAIYSQDIIVSSYPVKLILQEITGKYADIDVIVPFGENPFDSTKFNQDYLRGTRIADAFIYISDDFEPWAKNVNAEKKIAIFDFVPPEMMIDIEGNAAFTGKVLEKLVEAIGKNEKMKMSKPRNSVIQKSLKGKKLCPYFWHDPLVVQAILPELNNALTEIMPMRAGNFAQNANRFSARVNGVDIELRNALEPIKYNSFAQVSPILNYFTARYKLYNNHIYSNGLDKGENPFAVFSYNPRLKINSDQLEEEMPQALIDAKAPAYFYSSFDFPEMANHFKTSKNISRAQIHLFYGFSSQDRYFDVLYRNLRIIQQVYMPEEDD